jgi:hypothetical protein
MVKAVIEILALRMRREVLTIMNIKTGSLGVMTCSLVDGGTYFLLFQGKSDTADIPHKYWLPSTTIHGVTSHKISVLQSYTSRFSLTNCHLIIIHSVLANTCCYHKGKDKLVPVLN